MPFFGIKLLRAVLVCQSCTLIKQEFIKLRNFLNSSIRSLIMIPISMTSFLKLSIIQ